MEQIRIMDVPALGNRILSGAGIGASTCRDEPIVECDDLSISSLLALDQIFIMRHIFSNNVWRTAQCPVVSPNGLWHIGPAIGGVAFHSWAGLFFAHVPGMLIVLSAGTHQDARGDVDFRDGESLNPVIIFSNILSC